jgi:hypothetical protein
MTFRSFPSCDNLIRQTWPGDPTGWWARLLWKKNLNYKIIKKNIIKVCNGPSDYRYVIQWYLVKNYTIVNAEKQLNTPKDHPWAKKYLKKSYHWLPRFLVPRDFLSSFDFSKEVIIASFACMSDHIVLCFTTSLLEQPTGSTWLTRKYFPGYPCQILNRDSHEISMRISWDSHWDLMRISWDFTENLSVILLRFSMRFSWEELRLFSSHCSPLF